MGLSLGVCTNLSATLANSGNQVRTYTPLGSNFSACNAGLNTRKYGAASVPVPAVHCQPWLFEAMSPSTKCFMKNFAPHCHGRCRSLTRKLATIMRTRLCIHPVASFLVKDLHLPWQWGIEFDQIPTEAQVLRATERLREHFVGNTLSSAVFTARSDASADSIAEQLAAQAARALGAGSARETVFVGGTASLTRAFDAVEVVRSVLEALEQQYVVVSLVRDMLHRGVSVAIGAEHGVEPLSACSVVLAPLVRDGETVGSVGVLGPTRMNYPAALATVEVVSDRLGRRLTEG
ncbi:MAG: hypothetical protein EBV41_06395 [Actinobacteria bacterium]|nr:hypothetical protein [Actinomycetota bacterium]